MAGTTNDLHGGLDDSRKFLREKDLAPATHQPYLVQWVREFLLFAQRHSGYTFEQILDLFLAEVGPRVGVRPVALARATAHRWHMPEQDPFDWHGHQNRGSASSI
jgi:hypothetical protein